MFSQLAALVINSQRPEFLKLPEPPKTELKGQTLPGGFRGDLAQVQPVEILNANRFKFGSPSLLPHSESERLAQVHIEYLEGRLSAEMTDYKEKICILAASKRGIDVSNYDKFEFRWVPVYEMESVNGAPTGKSIFKETAVDCRFFKSTSDSGSY